MLNPLMRAAKIALLCLVLLVFAFLGLSYYFGPLGPRSPYFRFIDKNEAYYSNVADALDTILKEHPIGSIGLVRSKHFAPTWDLSVDDPSVPKIIRALRPLEILLATNDIDIVCGISRLSWGVEWHEDEESTNSWILSTYADGLVKNHYQRSK